MAHTLSLLQEPPYPNRYFVCNLCWERGSGPVYHCADCEFDLHTFCAAIGNQQTHFSHYQHPLHLKSVNNGHTCDGCGEEIYSWVYRCHLCDYDMHSLCVRAPRFVMHHSHPHALTLFSTGELTGSCQCDGCGRRASGMVYRCSSCNFDLHQSCVTLPLKPIHPKHPEHPLTLLMQAANGRSSFTCNDCGGEGTGWLYHCAVCRFNLHLGCAKILHEVPHSNVRAFSHDIPYSNVPVTFPRSVVRATTPIAPLVSTTDLDGAERVLNFVRHFASPSRSSGPLGVTIADASVQDRHSSFQSLGSSATNLINDDQDICPTCLEGYDAGNPKKNTKCGHHFHLPCIREWMERSNHCPVCRKAIVLGERH